MKVISKFWMIASMLIIMIVAVPAWSQNREAPIKSTATQSSALAPLLVENFEYSAGALLTDHGWTAHSGGGTNAIAVTSPGLTFTGYPGSGVGNAVTMTTSGEDDNRAFTPQASGTVYSSFLVRVSDAAVDPIGGYFFHLGPDPVGTTFRGRIFVKKDGSNNIAFGISKAATADPNVAFTGFTFSLNTTYLVVVKYTIVDGASNDTVDLFVLTNVPGSEPSPTVSALDNLTQSDISPGTVSLRQGTASTHPTLQVDGIRVATAWADIVGGGGPANVQHVVDYDGDGKTDMSVLRFPNVAPPGVSQITYWNKLSGGGVHIADWGNANTDFPAPGDYDGDEKTDLALYRAGASAGQQSTYFIFRSSDNTAQVVEYGLFGDQSIARDYDGDGITDPAVFRRGAAATDQTVWWIKQSTTNSDRVVGFGTTGNGTTQFDSAVPGDYDGDGEVDIAVYRFGLTPANFFIILRSSDSAVTYRQWGNFQTDWILPGDYDGDGTTDLCAGRTGATGTSPMVWWILNSSNQSVTVLPFGISSDFPTQGDYDGDGKTDLSIYRPGATATAQSFFWVRNSSDGAVTPTPWGLGADFAVNRFDSR